MRGGNHSRYAKALLFRYCDRRARKCFAAMRWRVDPKPWAREDLFPVVLYSNHETWWDGFLEIPFFTAFNLDYQIMMDAANLDKYWFFKYTGVFGVDLASPKGRAAGLLAASRFLRARDRPRRTLVIYPHGRLTEPFEPWPPFEGGLAAIARTVPEATFVPVVKKIVSREQPLPEVFLQAGAPFRSGERDPEEALFSLRDATEAAIRTREADQWARFRIRQRP